jgi:uncharacterized protein YndB with AHSA1/START domain
MAEFTTSIDIEATPEIVFDHLVTVEGMVAWMGQTAELDATPGGTFAVDIDGNPIRGEYLVVEPHHTVVVSWGLLGSDVLPVGSSRVEFRLTPIDTGTRVDLSHTDLPEDQVPPHAQGWPHFLGVLADVSATASAGAG